MMTRAITALALLLLVLPGFAQAQDEDGNEGVGVVIEGDEGEEDAPAPSADPEISIYRELKTVEADVDDLKEKVFRSKARLLLLEEKVIRGVVSGAKAVVRHVNELGPAYALESVTYYFDGNPIFQQTDVGSKGSLSKNKKEEIFGANIPPGNHTISVTGVIKGNGAGLFAYLSDYTFQFSSSYSFVAADGKTSRIDSVLFKKGGPAADYVEGPTVEFKLLDDKGSKIEGNEGGADSAEGGSGT